MPIGEQPQQAKSVMRQKASRVSARLSSQDIASAWCTCRLEVSPIQTLTSGKQIIEIEVPQIQNTRLLGGDQRKTHSFPPNGNGLRGKQLPLQRANSQFRHGNAAQPRQLLPPAVNRLRLFNGVPHGSFLYTG
jgi:hypothetical protein